MIPGVDMQKIYLRVYYILNICSHDFGIYYTLNICLQMSNFVQWS